MEKGLIGKIKVACGPEREQMVIPVYALGTDPHEIKKKSQPIQEEEYFAVIFSGDPSNVREGAVANVFRLTKDRKIIGEELVCLTSFLECCTLYTNYATLIASLSKEYDLLPEDVEGALHGTLSWNELLQKKL